MIIFIWIYYTGCIEFGLSKKFGLKCPGPGSVLLLNSYVFYTLFLLFKDYFTS